MEKCSAVLAYILETNFTGIFLNDFLFCNKEKMLETYAFIDLIGLLKGFILLWSCLTLAFIQVFTKISRVSVAFIRASLSSKVTELQ